MENPLKKIRWSGFLLFCICIVFIISFACLGIFAYKIYLDIGQADSPTINRFFLNKWDWLAFGVSLISLTFSFATAWSQWQTQRNTAKITPESQKQLLLDYARHFSTNLIVISALREKMKGKYNTHYPAEEHFLKLKVDMSLLHPAIFIQNIEKYQKICELQVLFRNFNEEVNVTIQHFTNPNLIVEAKERDLKTLEFKMGYFTKKVIETLNALFGKKTAHKSDIKTTIQKMLATRNHKDNNPILALEEAKRYLDMENNPYLQRLPSDIENLFNDKNINDCLQQFNEHIHVELNGINDSGSEKIALIPFPTSGYRF